MSQYLALIRILLETMEVLMTEVLPIVRCYEDVVRENKSVPSGGIFLI